MIKESWIFPSDGSAPYLRGERPLRERGVSSGVAFLPDLPDFVSPVDGKRYSGRAGMREHNLRNDVVPVEDLKGLPTLKTNSDMRSPDQRRRHENERRGLIAHQVYSKLRDQL